ncbi:MAG TPA: hypothetical protein V6D04_05530, partial [Candidatus Obscuribacterales bacterium]
STSASRNLYRDPMLDVDPMLGVEPTPVITPAPVDPLLLSDHTSDRDVDSTNTDEETWRRYQS